MRARQDWAPASDMSSEEQEPWPLTPAILEPSDGCPYPPGQHHLSLQSSRLLGAFPLHWTPKALQRFSLQKEQMSLEGLSVWQGTQRKKLGSSENPGLECPSLKPPWSAFCIHVTCRSVLYPHCPLSLGWKYFPLIGLLCIVLALCILHCILFLPLHVALWVCVCVCNCVNY